MQNVLMSKDVKGCFKSWMTYIDQQIKEINRETSQIKQLMRAGNVQHVV